MFSNNVWSSLKHLELMKVSATRLWLMSLDLKERASAIPGFP